MPQLNDVPQRPDELDRKADELERIVEQLRATAREMRQLGVEEMSTFNHSKWERGLRFLFDYQGDLLRYWNAARFQKINDDRSPNRDQGRRRKK